MIFSLRKFCLNPPSTDTPQPIVITPDESTKKKAKGDFEESPSPFLSVDEHYSRKSLRRKERKDDTAACTGEREREDVL